MSMQPTCQALSESSCFWSLLCEKSIGQLRLQLMGLIPIVVIPCVVSILGYPRLVITSLEGFGWCSEGVWSQESCQKKGNGEHDAFGNIARRAGEWTVWEGDGFYPFPGLTALLLYLRTESSILARLRPCYTFRPREFAELIHWAVLQGNDGRERIAH